LASLDLDDGSEGAEDLTVGLLHAEAGLRLRDVADVLVERGLALRHTLPVALVELEVAVVCLAGRDEIFGSTCDSFTDVIVEPGGGLTACRLRLRVLGLRVDGRLSVRRVRTVGLGAATVRGDDVSLGGGLRRGITAPERQEGRQCGGEDDPQRKHGGGSLFGWAERLSGEGRRKG